MRFKKGQQIVCTTKKWIVDNHPYKDLLQAGIHYPKFNEVVTCDGYETEKYIFLKEYSHIAPCGLRYSFLEKHFSPIIEDSQLETMLSEIQICQPI